MSKWIDAEWLRDELGDTNMDIYTDEVKEYIGSAPSIDIVRCGECKHWKRYDTTIFKQPAFRPCLRSGGMDSFTTWYDYCSLGERSEE